MFQYVYHDTEPNFGAKNFVIYNGQNLKKVVLSLV